jgi:hypothetical protein
VVEPVKFLTLAADFRLQTFFQQPGEALFQQLKRQVNMQCRMHGGWFLKR